MDGVAGEQQAIQRRTYCGLSISERPTRALILISNPACSSSENGLEAATALFAQLLVFYC